ncbi:MAG: hypothetical protein Greene041619_751 [Candidatus Peregrinibacteria bacterium Greene0416_19]|nr:MAG: hypothetical protein Greene041619_751 [Candidatus Peregrinibacteria bacterium Greene0416_19]
MARDPSTPPTAELVRRLMSACTALIILCVTLVLGAILSGFGAGSFVIAIGALIGLFGVSSARNALSDYQKRLTGNVPEDLPPVPTATVVQPAPLAATAPASKPEREEWELEPAFMRAQRDRKEATIRKPAEKKAPSALSHAEGRMQIDWEEWIGKKLLQKVGVIIVLIGMLVLLKYSFDNKIIGELGRIALATVAAFLLLGAGEWFHKKYPLWFQAFTGGGIVLLYFTVWAAHVFYANELLESHGLSVPPVVAFVLYGAITVIAALAAIRYNAQTIAWFGVLGGFLTPFLVTGVSSPVGLTMYLGILSIGILGLALFKRWRYLNIPAFVCTQLYLFALVYPHADISVALQIGIAVGFFLLFSLLPLVYQFRLRQKAEPEDILLIILSGATVFQAVVDATGGWRGEWVGLLSLGLAAFYVCFAAASLRNRGDDMALTMTYLIGSIGLIALAMYKWMGIDWVTLGWAPYSVVLGFLALRLRRRDVLHCGLVLLLGSLLFFMTQLPAIRENVEMVWHPFTSHWALLSYVVFASLLAWFRILRDLPQISPHRDALETLGHSLHIAVAGILFLAVTFEVTRLDFAITLPLAVAYLGFSLVGMLVFAATASLVWFIAAIIVQALVFLFTFFIGDTSGMVSPLIHAGEVTPIFHSWAAVSLLSFIMAVGTYMIVSRRRESVAGALPVRTMILVAASAQVWLHGTVEIQHLVDALSWSPILFHRTLSLWWTVFALAFVGWGLVSERPKALQSGITLLFLPLLKDLFLKVQDRTDLYETILWIGLPVLLLFAGILWQKRELSRGAVAMLACHLAATLLSHLTGLSHIPFVETVLWTALTLGLCVTGTRSKERSILTAGMLMFGALMIVDMLTNLSRAGSFLPTVWWALAGLAAMIAGFVEREKALRKLAIGVFTATIIKLLIFDFAVLTTGVRIGASIATGLLLIGASYLYQRFDAMLSRSTPR